MIPRRAFCLLFALLVAAPTAAAQTTVKIAFGDTILISSGASLVAMGQSVPSVATLGGCWSNQGFGTTSPGVRVVDIKGNVRLLDGVTSTPMRPGTRLQSLTYVGTCVSGTTGQVYDIYSAVVANPVQRGAAIVLAPSGVTLSSDHEAVATTASDASGNADTVCVKQGSQAIKTKLWTDITLLKGDRLVGFTFLAYDPTTGKTYYGAMVDR